MKKKNHILAVGMCGILNSWRIDTIWVLGKYFVDYLNGSLWILYSFIFYFMHINNIGEIIKFQCRFLID